MEDRCKGVTKSGKQCRNKNGLVNGYCKLHVNQAPDPKTDDMDEKPDSVFEHDHPVFSDSDELSKGAKTFYIIAAILVFIMIVKLLQKNGD
jgi:hypothetical protein